MVPSATIVAELSDETQHSGVCIYVAVHASSAEIACAPGLLAGPDTVNACG